MAGPRRTNTKQSYHCVTGECCQCCGSPIISVCQYISSDPSVRCNGIIHG